MEPRSFDIDVRRVPGGEAAARLLVVRVETVRAALEGAIGRLPPVPDAVAPDEIPSVAALGAGDRVLAEIDQDGFAFAEHPADVAYFNRREKRLPRIRYRLHIVLHGGRVCVRKHFTRLPPVAPRGARLWGLLGLFFYTEAAALLRLGDAAIAPRLHHISLASRTLFMDYLRGPTLQHWMAGRGRAMFDIDLDPLGQRFDDPERERGEIEAFAREGGEHRARVGALVRSMNARGVAPLDVKLGNVVVGEKTGALYWLDFERSAIASVPGYEARLREHHGLVDGLFGLSLSE